MFQEGLWPIELIDVEPLLDEQRTVVHYLGPHDLDTSGLLAALRSAYNLEVVFEPVGRDVPDEPAVEPTTAGCSCGRSGGGCGSGGGGCGTNEHGSGGGCDGCAIMKMTATSRSLACTPILDMIGDPVHVVLPEKTTTLILGLKNRSYSQAD